jgi:hypothetical protein
MKLILVIVALAAILISSPAFARSTGTQAVSPLPSSTTMTTGVRTTVGISPANTPDSSANNVAAPTGATPNIAAPADDIRNASAELNLAMDPAAAEVVEMGAEDLSGGSLGR